MDKQNIKQIEAGRSMVEMLGVLAIIGVLSIGGIAGYTMAMNKFRANELLDGASKRAVVAMQQISLGKTAGEVDLSEFPSDDQFGGVLSTDEGEIGVEVNSLKKAVCENLISMKGEDVYVGKKTGTDTLEEVETSDCTDDINLVVAYKMGGFGTGEGGGDDDDTGTCTQPIVNITQCDGTTIECCPDNNSCVPPSCSCQADEDCPGISQLCENETCGCPEGGGLGADGITCCKGNLKFDRNKEGYVYHNEISYDGIDIENCGCPPDYYNSPTSFGNDGRTCCTSDGRAYNNGSYLSTNYPACGCPESHYASSPYVGTDGITCCSNGYAWSSLNYSVENVSLCGCPNGGDLIGDRCCPGKVVDNVCCSADRKGYDENYNFNLKCNDGVCPYDFSMAGTEGTGEVINGVCCLSGYSYQSDGYTGDDPACR